MANPNRDLLLSAARLLEPLLARLERLFSSVVSGRERVSQGACGVAFCMELT